MREHEGKREGSVEQEVVRVIRMENNWMGEHDRGRMGVLVGEDSVNIILFSLYLVNNVGFSYEQPGIIAEISAEVIEPYYIELGPLKY